MEIDINDLINNDNIISYNIPKETNGYTASIIGEPNINSELTVFFATNTYDQKWYSTKTDRSILVKRLSKLKREWIFVIEDKSQLAKSSNYYILVKSVNSFVENITKTLLKNINKKIIAITGSVGKTTLARLLCILLENSQLIDVKRLTPLNLADFVFNQLKPTTDYIIAEVGLFYSGQIHQLANILLPYIGIITNIYDMHIGWNGIKTKSDLLCEKMTLLDKSKIKLISKELFDRYSLLYSLKNNNVLYNSSDYQHSINSSSILPKTNVSKNILELIEITLMKCNKNNFTINEIIKIIQENNNVLRFHKYTKNANELFVDSHSSIAGYFQAMSCHWYESVVLVILSLNFPSEENINENISLILKTFPNFKKVLISNKLFRYFGKNEIIKYINAKKFLDELLYDDVVIIHDPKAIRLTGKNEKKWKSSISNYI